MYVWRNVKELNKMLWKGVSWLLGRLCFSFIDRRTKSIPTPPTLHLYFYLYLSYKMCWVCLFSAIFYNDKILCFLLAHTHTHTRTHHINTHSTYPFYCCCCLTQKWRLWRLFVIKFQCSPFFYIHSHHFFLYSSSSYVTTTYRHIVENDDDDDTNLYFYI